MSTPRTESAVFMWKATREHSQRMMVEPDFARQLETELAAVTAQRNELQSLIKRSQLVETDGSRVESDSCGAPVLRGIGKILVHKDYMDTVKQRTKDLQAHANTARKMAAAVKAMEPFARFVFGPNYVGHKMPKDHVVLCGYDAAGERTGIDISMTDFEQAREAIKNAKL